MQGRGCGAVCADKWKRQGLSLTLSHEHCLVADLLSGLILSCYNWGTGQPQNFSTKSAEIRKNQVLTPLPYTDILRTRTHPILLPFGPLLVRSRHSLCGWILSKGGLGPPGQRQHKVNNTIRTKPKFSPDFWWIGMCKFIQVHTAILSSCWLEKSDDICWASALSTWLPWLVSGCCLPPSSKRISYKINFSSILLTNEKNTTLVFVVEKSRCRESPPAWLLPLASEVDPLVSHCLAGLREQDRTSATCTVRKEFSVCTQPVSLLARCPDTTSVCQKGSEGPRHPRSHHVPGARKMSKHGLGCTGFTHSSLAVYSCKHWIPVTSNRNTGKG